MFGVSFISDGWASLNMSTINKTCYFQGVGVHVLYICVNRKVPVYSVELHQYINKKCISETVFGIACTKTAVNMYF